MWNVNEFSDNTRVGITYPANIKTFVNYLYNVGPTYSTLAQHCMNVIQMFCVYWVACIITKEENVFDLHSPSWSACKSMTNLVVPASGELIDNAVQSQKAVSAYFTSKQISTTLWLCTAELTTSNCHCNYSKSGTLTRCWFNDATLVFWGMHVATIHPPSAGSMSGWRRKQLHNI